MDEATMIDLLREEPSPKELEQGIDAETTRIWHRLCLDAADRIAELERELADRCETCGAKLNVNGCIVCGAPVCCPSCCREATLEEELAEALVPLTAIFEAWCADYPTDSVVADHEDSIRAAIDKAGGG